MTRKRPTSSGPLAKVRLNRQSPSPKLHPFTDYFQGFERVGAVTSVFGERTEEVLRGLKIGFIPNRGMYMGIRDNDGNIAVGTYHLKNSPTRTLYLDVVHELFHIKQRMTSPRFFHDEFMKFMQDRDLYYASPIEIPAYRHTVREAERIGMSREEILEYLKIGRPPAKTWRNFVRQMELEEGRPAGEPRRRVTRFPVRINRKTVPALHDFTEFFLGFEDVGSVKELLGAGAKDILGDLKVEFIDSPFPTIYPSEEDGHLIVASQYFRSGELDAIYLDTFLSLSLVKLTSERAPAQAPGGEFGSDPAILGAYSSMVLEARRLGLGDDRIMTHLQLPRFMMTPAEYSRFLKAVGLYTPPSRGPKINN